MYRMIDCATWDDPWFSELKPDAKLLFLNLFTNRRTTPSGVFEVSTKIIAVETGLAVKRIEELLASGFGDKVVWWPDLHAIWVRNFYRRQKANDKFRIGAVRSIAAFPSPVRDAVCAEYPELQDEKDTHPIPIAYPSHTPIPTADTHGKQRTDQDQDQDQDRSEFGGVAAESETPSPPEPKPPEPLPENGEAQRIVAAYCRSAGIEKPALYAKAVGQAALLVKAGITAEDIGPLYQFVTGWADSADIGSLLGQVDKWRSSRNGHGKPRPLSPALQKRVDNWVAEKQIRHEPAEPYPEQLQTDIETWRRSQRLG